MPITIYPGSMKKRNANGSYSDLVPAIATDPEVLDDFAEEYSTSETYNIGDYCIHNSDFYRCNTNNTTGTWNNSAWDRVSVADELVEHKNTVNQLETNVGKILPVITGTTNNSGYPINTGDYFEANGSFYKANASIPINGAWSSSATTQTSTAVNKLKNSFEQSATTDFSINTTYCTGKGRAMKIGNVCVVTASITTTSTVASNVTMFTIPDGYRPKTTTWCMECVSDNGSNRYMYTEFVRAYSDGAVGQTISSALSSGVALFILWVYPV